LIAHLLDEATLAIGAMLILFSLMAFRRTRKFIAECRTVDGHVAGYTTEESDDGVYYYSVMRFRDRSGVEHELRGSSGLQEPPEVGATVGITYHPSDPSNAWVTGTAAPWVVPWFVLIVGLGFAIGGFVVRASAG
jgi:hypothetical protein